MNADSISLSKNELKEILNKNWMTHDAMWFYNCLKECGIEKTNKINKTAARELAVIEIKRFQKILGEQKFDSFDKFKQFHDQVTAIVTGKFMKCKHSTPARNLIHVEWESCFAYEGVKALGVIDHYECGIQLRLETWLDTLGIKYEVEPKVTGCMMHTEGHCFRDYRFFFDK